MSRIPSLAAIVVKVVPSSLMREIFRTWVTKIAIAGNVRESTRQLLELDSELSLALDQAAIRYDAGIHAKHRLTAYHDFFVDRVNPGMHVLDLGCGKGELAADLAQRAGARVTGVDWSESVLAFARMHYGHVPGLEFIHADILSYKPDGDVDVIVLSNVLEHIESRIDLLRSLARRFSSAKVLIRVPQLARDWKVPLRKEVGMFHFGDPTHVIEYSPEALEAELAEAGLEIKSVRLIWGEIWAEAHAG